MTLRFALCSAAVTAALIGSTVASAAATTVCAGEVFTPLQTDTFNFTQLSGTQTVTFNGFNTSLGTLCDVEMTITDSATVNDTASVFPSGSGPQSVGSPVPLTATATVSITGPDGLTATTSAVTTPGFVGTVPDNGLVNVVGTTTGVGSGSDTLFLPTDLSGFVGGPLSINLSVDAFGTQGGSVPPSVLTGNNGSASGDVTLQYSYLTVVSSPEPATLTLFGAALAGLGWARRRK